MQKQNNEKKSWAFPKKKISQRGQEKKKKERGTGKFQPRVSTKKKTPIETKRDTTSVGARNSQTALKKEDNKTHQVEKKGMLEAGKTARGGKKNQRAWSLEIKTWRG